MKKMAVLSIAIAAFIMAAAFRYASVIPKRSPRSRTATIALKQRYSLSCRVAPDPGPDANDIPPLTGWGPHRWTITTKSDSAQFYFNQGINLYYAFHTLEARASFARAIRFDSTCAMAWYGKALALGPTINYGNGYRAEYAAYDAAQKSIQFAKECTPTEKGLIAAIGKRYSADSTFDLKKLQTDYSSAMETLAAQNPKNADIVVLYADALMLEHPWDLYGIDMQPRPWTPQIKAILHKALALDSLHPGALHFMIHTTEGSLNPDEGLPSAQRLATLMPDVAHVTHMPSHIYIRTGNYKKGIDVNDSAIRNYSKYLQLYPPVEQDAGLYLLHAIHLKMTCAMMAGNYSIALAASDTLRSLIPAEVLLGTPGGMGNFYQYVYDARLFTLIRFGAWDSILTDRNPDTALRYSAFLHHFARGLAYSHKGQPTEAERELAELKKAHQNPILKASYDPFSDAYSAGQVAEDILTGVLAEQKGDNINARAAFEKAVTAEDALVYDEPRDWLLPARQYLGNLQLKTGDHTGAVATFQRDLQINPLNGWSLTGLGQAYTALKNKKALKKVSKDLSIAWQIKDREIKMAVY